MSQQLSVELYKILYSLAVRHGIVFNVFCKKLVKRSKREFDFRFQYLVHFVNL